MRIRSALLILAGLTLMVLAGSIAGRAMKERLASRAMVQRVKRLGAGESTGIRAGMKFPDIKLLSPEGGITGTGAILADRSTLVVFMVPGCESCTDTLKAWSLRQESLPEDVDLIAITEANPEDAAAYRLRTGIDLPIYSDPAQSFAERYEMTIFPTLVGVSASGTVAFVRHGLGGNYSLEVAARNMVSGSE